MSNTILLNHQTRFINKQKGIRGNCYPTVISCIMGIPNPEDVLQFQEYYDAEDHLWYDMLTQWLDERGWEIEYLPDHLYDDSFYFVSGKTVRESSHICIYQNGKLYHDPHPEGTGLISTNVISQLVKIVK